MKRRSSIDLCVSIYHNPSLLATGHRAVRSKIWQRIGGGVRWFGEDICGASIVTHLLFFMVQFKIIMATSVSEDISYPTNKSIESTLPQRYLYLADSLSRCSRFFLRSSIASSLVNIFAFISDMLNFRNCSVCRSLLVIASDDISIFSIFYPSFLICSSSIDRSAIYSIKR